MILLFLMLCMNETKRDKFMGLFSKIFGQKSDVQSEKTRIGDFIVEPPFVLGHEAGGTVVEVGEGVTHLKAGDKVAMEPGKTCGHCEHCKAGKYNLCEDVIFFATPPVDGVF